MLNFGLVGRKIMRKRKAFPLLRDDLFEIKRRIFFALHHLPSLFVAQFPIELN
jgi:hypothetical protein